MASASTTPMRPISHEWSSLPVELRLQIFGYVAGEQRSRTTELVPFTFRRLLIDNSQLDRFSKATEGKKAMRLSYIRYLCLRIKLQDYDYPECDRPESHATINWNKQRFTNSLIELFRVLRRWNPSSNRDTGLIFEITAYSPGDNRRSEGASMEYALHENFQLAEDLASSPSMAGFMYDKDARDRLATGMIWHSPTTVQGLERLHGTPPVLTTKKDLKEVPIVHTLWIRHQLRRGINGSSLARILRMALTKVTSFRLETAPDPHPQLRYFSDWNSLISKLPHHIRHFSLNIFPRHFFPPLFMNATFGLPTSLTEKALAERAHHLMSLCPPAGTNSLNLIQHLRKSQQLEHGSRLAQLCLEVPYDPRGGASLFQGQINHLLKEAAVTARHLPELKILEIWCHERMKAFVFRYEHEKDQVTITWRTSEDWINLAEGSIQQWQGVAQKYIVVFSVKELPVLRNPPSPSWVISYGDGHIDRKVVYSQLKLRDLAIHPVTLARADIIRIL
ncbi:hypothetical protein FPCIR_8781 [Fusarium pseudocircinatum]|uniref:DUF6546 domain-containing protein n=1 Tax=Fusarium pseudocircinatum TaxID=56676 RepID=A0A8H5L5E8_9HYPO|nr:hypothetical protein FPCIR_8781 [Fusarium pseudocircinatum]